MKRYLAVLGRQAEISMTELMSLFSDVRKISPGLAIFSSDDEPSIDRLGGTLKLAEELEAAPLEYLVKLPAGKITLAISDYRPGATGRSVGKEALQMKKALSNQGRGIRVLTEKEPLISSASAHHNQLGEKPNHIELIRLKRRGDIGEWWRLIGVQNISAYARRDQARPARDAKVGMLPPKLAQILINLCGPLAAGTRILDPFCGTGVVLQEALLMGYEAYGTDLSERMVEYSKRNLEWLSQARISRTSSPLPDFSVAQGDARDFSWELPIGAVACEAYLGRPMSQPPAEIKLKAEKQECSSIILGFLRNLVGQISSGTPVVMAIPAWLRPDGSYARLNIIDEIEKMGYNVVKYNCAPQGLLYHREGQVVAREIIVLRKK